MTEKLNKKKIWAFSFIACVLGVVIAGILGEVVLRTFFVGKKFYVWPPTQKGLFYPDSEKMIGIAGEAAFTINSEGFRSREFSNEDDYKVLSLGGSTTECLYLDDKEAWPYLLEKSLSSENFKVWVGNAGKSGHGSIHHEAQMKYLLEQYPDINSVVIMLGVNDFMYALAVHTKNQGVINIWDREKVMEKSFFVSPLAKSDWLPWYKRTGYWFLGRRVKQWFRRHSPNVQDKGGINVQRRRDRRKQAKVFYEELPDLSGYILEYQATLNRMIDLAEKKSIKLVFMTQPFMWQAKASEEMEKLFLFGWVGSPEKATEYYSTKALAEGMKLYNEALLEVCGERKVSCIDLAKKLPKTTESFYDDVHFNESGARLVAKEVSVHFKREVLI